MAFFQKVKEFFSGGEKSSDLMSVSAFQTALSWRNRSFTNIAVNSAHTAYRAHALVFSCVNKTADVMNDAEIIVEAKNRDGEWEEVPDHPLKNLFRKPNQHETGRNFRRLMVQSELTTGIFYAETGRSRAGLIAELYPLNPACVRPELDQSRTEISYYEYTRPDGSVRRIAPEDMIIRRRVDLVNRFYGLAPVEVALKEINSDLGMADYIDAFFENDGTPSGLLKILNASLNATKKEAVAADWSRKYRRGGSNQKGIAVLDQDMNFETIGSKINELEADSLTGRFETRICTVFGVPPILVGAHVGLRHTTANATAKAALNDFWDNKISPELAELREWLTWFVLPEFEDIALIKAGRLRVSFDISQAKFLQEEVGNIHDRARQNFQADGWTRNEFREATGKPPVEGGDMFRSDYINVAGLDRRAGDDTLKNGHRPKLLKSKKNSEYRRELSAVEKLIDLKSIEDDIEKNSESLDEIVQAIREDLINQAADQVNSPEDLPSLDLVVSSKMEKRLKHLLEKASEDGRDQILDEIEAQTGKSITRTQSKNHTDIKTLVSLIITRIVSEIRTRAVNLATVLYATDSFADADLEDGLFSESEKMFALFARNFANAAIQSGRFEEMETNSQIEKYEYSAILDANLCDSCERWDGVQSEDINDLPSCPNKDCEGNWNCRCVVIGIVV